MMMMDKENLMYFSKILKQFIGSAETTLATIAGSKDQLAILSLSNG